ncbi:hypothetical protein OCU04_008089 [Sclerotinia nivalis]|uniref:AB hydrolase-1 domain-containing protein n=1 Tax=Sclerotinia nivalis TaxID=352851 RepID=A0A9X0AHC1_9HELO|nr:hypothetical protein OCU04_008089 [Sclerotinia nivalis]
MRGLLGFMSLARLPFSQGSSFASTTPTNSSILSTHGFSSPSLSYSAAQKAVCVTGYLDVPVQATTTEILYDGPTNNTQLTSLLISLFALDSTVAAGLVGGTTSISTTYTIYSKLCVPTNATIESIKTVHFLTHGGTTDYTYCDFATDYSYVDAAAARGYATFSYDRLGTGLSQHPDPIQVVQVATQVELAHALISGLKAGSYGGVTFGNAIGVGHSLGSALTQSISALTQSTSANYPSDFTALALTGHSGFQGGVPIGIASQASQIANTIDLPQFSGLANGYITESSTPQAIQFAFFHYPGYDETILEKQLATRQTNALGETFTLGAAYVPATGFTGPVIILNGNENWF